MGDPLSLPRALIWMATETGRIEASDRIQTPPRPYARGAGEANLHPKTLPLTQTAVYTGGRSVCRRPRVRA